jgi:hypothetical protein
MIMNKLVIVTLWLTLALNVAAEPLPMHCPGVEGFVKNTHYLYGWSWQLSENTQLDWMEKTNNTMDTFSSLDFSGASKLTVTIDSSGPAYCEYAVGNARIVIFRTFNFNDSLVAQNEEWQLFKGGRDHPYRQYKKCITTASLPEQCAWEVISVD